MNEKTMIITFGVLFLTINIVGLSLIYNNLSNSSCSEIENNFDDFQKFVGEWYKIASHLKEIKSYIFRTNGTFTYTISIFKGEDIIQNGTYEVQNGKLILNYEKSEIEVYYFIFSSNSTYVTLFDISKDMDIHESIELYTWEKYIEIEV